MLAEAHNSEVVILISPPIWFAGSRNGAFRSFGPIREWAVPGTGAQNEQLPEPNGAVPSQSA